MATENFKSVNRLFVDRGRSQRQLVTAVSERRAQIVTRCSRASLHEEIADGGLHKVGETARQGTISREARERPPGRRVRLLATK